MVYNHLQINYSQTYYFSSNNCCELDTMDDRDDNETWEFMLWGIEFRRRAWPQVQG